MLRWDYWGHQTWKSHIGFCSIDPNGWWEYTLAHILVHFKRCAPFSYLMALYYIRKSRFFFKIRFFITHIQLKHIQLTLIDLISLIIHEIHKYQQKMRLLMFNLLNQPVKDHIFGQITHRPYVNIDYSCFKHHINTKISTHVACFRAISDIKQKFVF